MIHCLVVDDEPLAQEVLAQHIRNTPGLALVAKCFTAAEAFAVLHDRHVDLMFIDIRMPGIPGTEFIRSLKHPPAFVFTTAYSEYAVMSYELQALDYLVKPVTYDRFKKSIDRFSGLRTDIAKAETKQYVYLKVNGELVKVSFDDILFAQSLKDYIRVTTRSGTFLTHLTMKALTNLLPVERFARVHRSYLVNRQHIQVIGRNTVVIAGSTIPVGEHYRTGITGG